MPVAVPKTIIGNTICAKASHITNDAARIYGSLWKSKKVNGVVIASEKIIPDGSARIATFVTAEWSLPGRVLVKELNGRLVQYVADENDEGIQAEQLPDDTVVDAPDAAVVIHAVPEPVNDDPAPVAATSPPRTPLRTPTPPQSPTTSTPPADTPIPVHELIPVPPLPPIVTVPPAAPPTASTTVDLPVAQVAHGRAWVIDDAATEQVINGVIPSRLWYITDLSGDRINSGDYLKIQKLTLLDLFLLMFPPDHLVEIISLTNIKLRAMGEKETTKGEIVKFFGVIVLGTRFVFASRRDLWSTTSVSRLIDPLNFGKRTGVSRNRFDALWSCIRFSEQPEERDGDSKSGLSMDVSG